MLLSIPSPPISGWQIGPIFLHIYALCLISGMVAAWILGSRRWQARGGNPETFENVVIWTIPLGIVGARIYHVLTHLGDYVGPGRNPWTVFAIWEGGIAIYGAIGGGALAAWLLCRRYGVRFSSLADSLAPGLAIGQALGRFGNWFNQELYGQPTTLPWGLEIDRAHRAPGYEQYATFHPTFAYESIWNLLVAGVLLWADKRWKLGRGKVFALYLALYGFGRFFTEGIRLDYSYDTFGPIRFNQMGAAVICLLGVALLVWLVKNRPGREDGVSLVADAHAAADADADADAGAETDGASSTTDAWSALDADPEPEQDGAAHVDGDSPEPEASAAQDAVDPQGEPPEREQIDPEAPHEETTGSATGATRDDASTSRD